MTLFLRAVDKNVRLSENSDKMTLFLQVGVIALQAGWQGDVEELARLVVNAENAVDGAFPLEEAISQAQELGWRGSPDELIRAWLQDPNRVENLLWYARQKGRGAGLLRNALRSGEWPPEWKPGSDAELDVWRRQAEMLAEIQEDADV